MVKHKEINQWLKARIQDGTYAANDRLPSENDLAALFGCSRQTVRQAIMPLQAEGFLASARGSGTYVSEQAAELFPPPSRRIGVLMAYPEDSAFPGILTGLEETLALQNYTIALGITHNRPAEEENCLRRILDNGVAGMIIEGTKTAMPNGNAILYQEIAERKIPVVFLNSCRKECRDSYVAMDDSRAGEMAAEALIADGHLRIGGFFPSDDSRGVKRYKGFQHALKQRGYALPEGFISWYTSESLPYLLAEDSAKGRFPHCFDITGLVCGNEHIAVSWLSMLCECKKPESKHYSIVSFGGGPMAGLLANAVSCGFASIQCPSRRTGQLAAELMLKKLTAPSCCRHIILTPEIQILSKKGSLPC